MYLYVFLCLVIATQRSFHAYVVPVNCFVHLYLRANVGGICNIQTARTWTLFSLYSIT
jgi:hypothetical protein